MKDNNIIGHSVSLEGVNNTRDLGGMKARDGRCIKPKKLVRSGRLSHATQNDIAFLAEDYCLRCVIDFRTDEEREHAPNPHEAFSGVRFVSTPILSAKTLGITRETLTSIMQVASAVTENPVSMMSSIYPKMLLDKESQQGFRNFFEEILNHEEGAMLWHCTVGKDRAGLATVLLLTVLDIEPAAITNDYLLSNKHMQSSTQEVLSALASYGVTNELRSCVQVFNSADTRFLQSGFDAVESAYGSISRYIEEALDVTAEKAEALKEKYLIAV